MQFSPQKNCIEGRFRKSSRSQGFWSFIFPSGSWDIPGFPTNLGFPSHVCRWESPLWNPEQCWAPQTSQTKILRTGGSWIAWKNLPLWKIWKSMGRIVPCIMENEDMFETTNQIWNYME
jgi:hypothetical protein